MLILFKLPEQKYTRTKMQTNTKNNLKVALISTKENIASYNIAKELVGNQCAYKALDYEKYPIGEFEDYLYLFNKGRIIDFENLDKIIDADFFLFLSTHRSRNPIPCLTVHSIGNFSVAELGGKDRKLVPSFPKAILLGLRLQKRAQELGWEFFQEVTHHGPYLEKPSMFIEIGSTESEWNNKRAVKIVSENILELLRELRKPLDHKIAIGIGGLHNAIPLRSLSLDDNYAIGHICPKYMLEHLDNEMILEMINKTPGTKTIILDWKGLGHEKRRILNLLEENFKNYEIIKKK